MREVIMYYAYDDTEFDTYEECAGYEEKAFNYLEEICEKYAFFDKNMNLYCAPLATTEIDDWLNWLSNAVDNCEFVHREENLSIAAEHFIDEHFGFGILNSDFNNEIGWFKYNIQDNEWNKVDE